MKIIAHRGYWLDPLEKNSRNAFARAAVEGFGIETDFRDRGRDLVVSHDPPTAEALDAASYFAGFAAATPLAINVKADGLSGMVKSFVSANAVREYFVFDMSIPETLRYLELGLDVFIRVSEYESDLSLLPEAAGVWVDYFDSDGWTPDEVCRFLDSGKRVCIVSPELHQRPAAAAWERIFATLPVQNDRLSICTDQPLLFGKQLEAL